MKKTIKYLQDGEYHYATVKDVGDLEQLKTQHKEDLVTALNELFTTGGDATPTGYDDLVKKVNDTQTTVDGINNTITDINGKVVANNEAITQAKKDLQDALTQFQTFNDEIEQAKKDAETKLADAKQALKDEFNNNLADAQKANQKQLEDKVAVIQGNLDTTSNTLNDVKTQLTNAKLDYGNVNVSIQKLNDMLATKLSSTDLDPLRTSIQNQESEIQQTKDSIATKAGKAELDVLSGRVSNTEAKIKQQADEISLGVKKSELNGAIDNYQVEGTNRLRDTIDFDIDNGYWKLDQYSINSNTDVHPYDQAHDISALVLQKTGSAKQDVDFTNEDLGNSFVISVWNKKDAQPQVWYGNTQLTGRQVADIKGDYERSFFTFIPTNVNVKTIMFKYDAGTVDQLVIGEPKLELGTKPKAYAPNPNDEHKQIVNTKAELKIASDKIESTVEKQTKTDNNINQLSSRVTQTEQGITATNDLITKTKDGLIKDYTGKINASAKSLSSEFDEKTDEKIGQITDSGENLILNSAFTNETDRKDKWQNISDKVNIVDDGNGLMWAKMSQSGLTADNPISLTSNYFPIKQGKITVGVDIKSDNTNGLSGAKILVLQTYNANKQRVDFTELTLENMGLTVQQLTDGQSHRGVYRLGNDRSDAVYMTVKTVLPRNGSIYFTNFSAKLSSIDSGGYTPNAEDLKRQILNQKTKIEQNSQQITLKASSTELRDVRTIANGAASSANNANKTADTALTNANSAVSVANNANTNANSAKSTANNANNNATSAVSVANQANATATQAKNNASNAVNTANSANTTASNAVNTANQANNKIDNLQIGGVNLLTGSKTMHGVWAADGTSIFNEGDHLAVRATDTNMRIYQNPSEDTTGKLMSVSFDAEVPTDSSNQSVQILVGPFQAGVGVTISGNAFKRYKVENWKWNSANKAFSIWFKNANDKINIRKIKLEFGNKATDWQPAPEDIQSQIDQARTDIQSTLTVANNGITAATNLKTTYDNYVQKNDANIKLLGDRITNEVSKITSNGGGRNLWLNSKSFQNANVNAPQVDWNTDSDGITTAHITGTGGFYGKWQYIYANSTEPFAIGDLETFSVEMKGTGTITIGREHDFEKAITLTNTWTRYSVSGEVKAVNRAHIMYNESGKDCDAYVRLPMVEKGTVAHDWQPAPEDTNSQIEAVSSKIDQTATSITSTVNSTKQDLQGQINSANTKITQTANSITEQLKSYSKTGDMQNYVNTTVQKTADGISAKVSGVESRIDEANTKIDKTATNLTSTVNSTKQDLQGKIDSTKQNLQGQITQTANDINDKVSGVENKVDNANSKINDITSNGGGRNLLRNSDVELHGKAYDFANVPLTVDHLEPGETYTMSWYGKVDANATKHKQPLVAFVYNTSWSWQAIGVIPYTVNDYQRNVFMFTVPKDVTDAVNHVSFVLKHYNDDGSQSQHDKDDDAGIGYVKNYMLEKGMVAHEWQPAPEDTDSAIQTTKADLVQQITDAKNAAIQVSKDSITSEVSDVRTTITQVDNKVSGVNDKVNSTKQDLQGQINSANTKIDNTNTKIDQTVTNINDKVSGVENKVDNLQTSGRNYIKDSESITMHPNGTDNYDLVWSVYNNAFSANAYCHGNNKTRFSFYLTPSKALTTAKTYSIYWRQSPYITFGTITVPAGTTDTQYYKLALTTPTSQPIASQIFIRFMADSTSDVSYTITKSMLTIGDSFPDWQPAPEDTDNRIDNVNTKIDKTATNINDKVDSAKQDLQGQISNVNTKVEQYKTGIDQTATGMNLFAQVITGNKSIDVTKSNIGIDPNQIKIASNKIVIDGDTSINGTLKVPNVKLQGKSGSIDLSGDMIALSSNDGKSRIGISSAGGIMLQNDKGDSLLSTPLGLEITTNTNGRVETMGRITTMAKAKDTNQNGIGIILERQQTLGDPYGGDAVLIGEQRQDGGVTASMVWDATGTLGKGFHWYDNHYVQTGSTITIENTDGSRATQDSLMIIGKKDQYNTQDGYFQPTLMAGYNASSHGDSGLTFYWNSVKAFGTFDLRDTHVLGNRNTHFSVETTFDTDGEANMCFTWTSRSDLWNNLKLPMLARADWWTSQWGSCGILFANGQLFYVCNDGHTYKRLN